MLTVQERSSIMSQVRSREISIIFQHDEIFVSTEFGSIKMTNQANLLNGLYFKTSNADPLREHVKHNLWIGTWTGQTEGSYQMYNIGKYGICMTESFLGKQVLITYKRSVSVLPRRQVMRTHQRRITKATDRRRDVSRQSISIDRCTFQFMIM